MTTVKSTWTGGSGFTSEFTSGHQVMTDAPAAAGGEGAAPSPMELVLAGLAACTGVDVASILTRMRVPLQSLEVTAEAERSEAHPRVFTAIRLRYLVRGEVPEKKLEKAIALSESKYCSAAAMLACTATIAHDWTIEP